MTSGKELFSLFAALSPGDVLLLGLFVLFIFGIIYVLSRSNRTPAPYNPERFAARCAAAISLALTGIWGLATYRILAYGITGWNPVGEGIILIIVSMICSSLIYRIFSLGVKNRESLTILEQFARM